MNNKEIKEQRDAARAELKRVATQAEGTMCDVVDEAAEHLIDHYDPRGRLFLERDFCLLLSRSFFGHDKQKGNPVMADEFLVRGDMHMMSHAIADKMAESPEFAAIMFHAVEVYSRGKCQDYLNDR